MTGSIFPRISGRIHFHLQVELPGIEVRAFCAKEGHVGHPLFLSENRLGTSQPFWEVSRKKQPRLIKPQWGGKTTPHPNISKGAQLSAMESSAWKDCWQNHRTCTEILPSCIFDAALTSDSESIFRANIYRHKEVKYRETEVITAPEETDTHYCKQNTICQENLQQYISLHILVSNICTSYYVGCEHDSLECYRAHTPAKCGIWGVPQSICNPMQPICWGRIFWATGQGSSI